LTGVRFLAGAFFRTAFFTGFFFAGAFFRAAFFAGFLLAGAFFFAAFFTAFFFAGACFLAGFFVAAFFGFTFFGDAACAAGGGGGGGGGGGVGTFWGDIGMGSIHPAPDQPISMVLIGYSSTCWCDAPRRRTAQPARA